VEATRETLRCFFGGATSTSGRGVAGRREGRDEVDPLEGKDDARGTLTSPRFRFGARREGRGNEIGESGGRDEGDDVTDETGETLFVSHSNGGGDVHIERNSSIIMDGIRTGTGTARDVRCGDDESRYEPNRSVIDMTREGERGRRRQGTCNYLLTLHTRIAARSHTKHR
jgi:hypothetical protein